MNSARDRDSYSLCYVCYTISTACFIIIIPPLRCYLYQTTVVMRTMINPREWNEILPSSSSWIFFNWKHKIVGLFPSSFNLWGSIISLAPRKCGNNFKSVFFKLILWIHILRFQFHFQFWNFNWAAIPILELNWPNPACNGVGLNWWQVITQTNGDQNFVAMWCHQASVSLLHLQIKGDSQVLRVQFIMYQFGCNGLHQTGDKPLPEPVMTRILSLYWVIRFHCWACKSWLSTSWDLCCQHTI